MFCELGDIQVEEIKKMKIGDPLDRSTDHGPQNHKAHLEKLLQYCEAGVKEGATLVYGGRQVPRPGKIASEVHTDGNSFHSSTSLPQKSEELTFSSCLATYKLWQKNTVFLNLPCEMGWDVHILLYEAVKIHS